MRFLLFKLRLLLGLLAIMFLVSCTVDDAVTPPPEGINTLNIFFDNNKIYSVDPDTGITIARAEFDIGTHALALNIDEAKQGFEYAAYINNGSLFLFNYVTAEKTFLIALSDSVCDIFPRLKASDSAFIDRTKSSLNFVNLPTVAIAYQNGNTCSPETNFRDVVDFSTLIDGENNFFDGAMAEVLNQDLFFGKNIIDFTSGVSLLGGFVDDSTLSGFLGYDLGNGPGSGQLRFTYTEKGIGKSWRTSLPYFDTPPSIWQASELISLIQVDEKIYAVPVATLFSINDPTLGSGSIQAQIDALFETPSLTLPNSTPVSVNLSTTERSFLIKQGNVLYFYDGSTFTEIFENVDPDVIKFTADLVNEEQAVIVKEFAASFVLALVNTTTNVTNTLVTTSEKINIKIRDSELFINTYKQGTSTGWQAILYDANQTQTIYNNSRFLLFDDTRNQLSTVLILGSDQQVQEDLSLKEQWSIYDFNRNESDGRRKVRLEGEDIGFRFGTLQITVDNILASTIINDIYGFIKFEGSRIDENNASSNVIESYFFNPGQLETSKQGDIDKKQSLRLVHFTE